MLNSAFNSQDSNEADAFYSVTIELNGRMMREDFSEQRCQIVRMSPAIAEFVATNIPNRGEKIISYVEQIGRLEGVVSRATPGGFEVQINATPRKQSKLAAQLTWLANKHELGAEDDRRHDRLVPRNQNSEIRLADGRTYPCRIIDLSVSGAAFEIDVKPEMGSEIWLGSMKGRVVRHFDTGVSMEFSVIRHADDVEQQAVGRQ